MTNRPTIKSELERLKTVEFSSDPMDYINNWDGALILINQLVKDRGVAREVLESVWYSEFGNSETCLEGEQIKQALSLLNDDRVINDEV